MLKLLISLFAAFAVAVVLLQLREQRRDLAYQSKALHSQIQQQQGDLWNQQIQIAIYTAPNAIEQTVGSHAIKLIAPPPQFPAAASPFDTPPAAPGTLEASAGPGVSVIPSANGPSISTADALAARTLGQTGNRGGSPSR